MATLFDMQLLAPRGASGVRADRCAPQVPTREFYTVNLLVRIHEMIRWTGLAPLEFESPFSGSLVSTSLAGCGASGCRADRCAPQVPKLDGEKSVNDKLTILWGR